MHTRLLQALVVLILFGVSTPAFSDKLCVQKKTKVSSKNDFRATRVIRKVATSRCPSGFSELIDTTSFQGPIGLTGATGPAGADGNPLFYGDSTTPLTVNAGTQVLDTSSGPLVLNFSELTITEGSTLVVGSGSTIRVAGPCTIAGTLSVARGAESGSFSGTVGAGIVAASSPPSRGMAARVPESGSAYNQTDSPGSLLAVGGRGGQGTESTLNGRRGARFLYPVDSFGGGGAVSVLGSSVGGDGGGALRLLCEGSLTVTSSGVIQANGVAGDPGGGGGGGGGLLVLASAIDITSLGTISVRGGVGGPAASFNQVSAGPGGGGGGGAIILVAPNISVSGGVANVNGGVAGASGLGTPFNNVLSGGGGGGAGVGDGGEGGAIDSTATFSAQAGLAGEIYLIDGDPRAVIVH